MPPLILELTPDDYEYGVAELLALKFGDRANVEHNVRLPSRSGGADRQIDVLVRIPLADVGEALMVVDCKKYGTKVDIKDVEAFVGLVRDVGAPMGLLVTTEGFTSGARTRVAAERGIHIQVVRVEDLPRWEPPLITCESCGESVGPESMPGMVYADHESEIETEDGEWVSTTLGYCEKCGTLHVSCPRCGTVNVVIELRDREWIECEGGCGTEWYQRPATHKDDLIAPIHDRVTFRFPSD